jgi:enterobactin synthetase component D
VIRQIAAAHVLPHSVAVSALTIDLLDEHLDLSLFCDVSLPQALQRAVRKRQIEYLAGRWCVRDAFARKYPNRSAEVHNDDQRAPVWPDGIVGSITHTQGYVSAAVADRGDIRSLGIDTEVRFDSQRALRLRDTFVRPNEFQRLGETWGLEESVLATTIFSAKESVFKCLHPFVRRHFGFQCAEILALETDGALTIRLMESLTPSFAEGTILRGHYVVTETHVHTSVVLF